MSNAIEIEAKALVSEKEYLSLVALFPSHPAYTQTNYYIDTQDRLLAKEGIALRIRERDDRFELTLKTPLSEGKLEKNALISREEFDAFLLKGIFPKGDTARFLTMLDFNVEDLRILTSLKTKRVDIEYENGLLSLDKNTYSGITDYEIEFEYNNLQDAEVILKNFLESHHVPCVFSKATKVHRAMAAIGK